MRIIRQTGASALALALGALLGGCEPQERAEWSPDGSRAAVLVEQRLHFTDPQGVLSDAVADRDEAPGRLLVDAFDWLPDSSGLVAHRVRVVSSWEGFSPLLTPSDSARVESLAGAMPSLLRTAVAIHGDSDRIDSLLGKIAPSESLALSNALLLAMKEDPASVREALAGAPLALASLVSGEKAAAGFVLHEIAVLRPDSDAPTEILSRGFHGVHSLRASPRHPVVAATLETGEENRYDLLVWPLSAAPPLVVVNGVTRAFDWTPDGASLVYMNPISEGQGGLVEIERRRVLDGDDKLALSLPEDGGGRELAYAVVAFATRLAVLPNGEILFASHPLSLPSAAADLGENPRLYRLPADGGAPIAIPTEAGALPMDLGYFVPSPDGRRLAVVESGTDAVALVDLESGKTELVSPPHAGWKTRVMPSWRTAEEFSFAAADPASGRVRWMMWKAGNAREISGDWPDKTTTGWVESKNTTP